MNHSFYTIGHSTRSIDEFAGMLTNVDVTLLIDVRTVPRSRTNPQYNENVLPDLLAPFHIGYARIAALGGLRGKDREVPPGVNAFWQNQNFHNYADYAMGNEFRVGFARLLQLGSSRCCAIMCAETLWWRCHRRIISDYLLADGQRVFHLMGPGKVEPARMTQGAMPGPSGTVTYPAVS